MPTRCNHQCPRKYLLTYIDLNMFKAVICLCLGLFIPLQLVRPGYHSLDSTKRHTISTDPFLPFFSSFAIVHEYKAHEKLGVISGLWISRANATYPGEFKYPGHVDNYSIILAIRGYAWRSLHTEYQLYPGYSRFYLDGKSNPTSSFSLFNEFRIGYVFNFTIGRVPLSLNLQWPVGFTLYESNEPPAFREVKLKDPIFYIFYPNIYLGYRF
jgi:hypothetical protein